MPVGVGHEFSGTVLEVGSQAENKQGLKVGDHVAVQPTICCWSCGPCEHGHINSCDKAGFVGLSGGGGGMSEAVCIDDGFVFKLPESIPLDIGALVEPLAVAWHAVDQYDIQKGDSALVLGAGPIGLGVVQCLKARGAEIIIVAEVAKQRQDYATHFGATHILDPRTDDVVTKCKELCDGQGPKVALDCAGVAASIKTAALAVRARGTVVNVAIWEKEVPVQPNWFVFGEKQFKAGKLNSLWSWKMALIQWIVLGYLQKDYAGVIDAISEGKLQPVKMITSKIRVDRVVEDGYTPWVTDRLNPLSQRFDLFTLTASRLINEKDKHVKILVDMNAWR
jgi:threonine dehydrogenase-like Zn-dependent dehydrogenase